MITCYDIVKTLLRTEKSTRLEPDRKYFFRVSTNSTKVAIKNAVEEIYKVKVQAVQTIHVAGKRKRVRQQVGYASNWKKAIVTLKDGQKIEVT